MLKDQDHSRLTADQNEFSTDSFLKMEASILFPEDVVNSVPSGFSNEEFRQWKGRQQKFTEIYTYSQNKRTNSNFTC